MKYVHTNVIARDWRTLAAFYENVFGCVRVPAERNLAGDSIERGSGVAGARIQGGRRAALPPTVACDQVGAGRGSQRVPSCSSFRAPESVFGML